MPTLPWPQPPIHPDDLPPGTAPVPRRALLIVRAAVSLREYDRRREN